MEHYNIIRNVPHKEMLTPCVTCADPQLQRNVHRSPSMPRGERQALHEPRDVDRRDPVCGEFLAAVERAEHRAVDDRSGVEPFADVRRGAQPAVGDERHGDFAGPFPVGFASAQRHDQVARIVPQIRNVERGGFGTAHGAGERQQQQRAVALGLSTPTGP
jgi:hypothetical protein